MMASRIGFPGRLKKRKMISLRSIPLSSEPRRKYLCPGAVRGARTTRVPRPDEGVLREAHDGHGVTPASSHEEPGETDPPEPFRFTPVALLAVVIHTVLVLATPPNPVQGAFAVAAVLATGYCALSLVLGRSLPLSLPELLALVVGFSVLTISVAAVLVSTLGIRFENLIIDSVGLPIAALAVFQTPRGRPRIRGWPAWLSGLLDLRDYSRTEKATAVVLGGAVLVVTVLILATVYGTHYPEPLSPGLAIVGPDGTPFSLPTAFVVGAPRDVRVTALGGEVTENVTVAIQLIPVNATGNGTFHPILWDVVIQLDPYGEARNPLTLEARGNWTETVSIAISTPGSYWLRFSLIRAGASIAAQTQIGIAVVL